MPTLCAPIARIIAVAAIALAALWPTAARGDIVVLNQQPLNVGGGAADTAFVNDSGDASWQQVADDFTLGDAAVIHRIVWWGFYGGSFGPHEDPPATETMRIRLYDSRPIDGLPGNVVFQESFLDPRRVPTGRQIFLGGLPDEQRYQVDFPTPLSLAAGTPYWLEIVQLGDISSLYRWEVSPGNQTPFAVSNRIIPDWHSSGLNANLAFQLSTVPEPRSLFVFSIGIVMCVLSNWGRPFNRRLNRENPWNPRRRRIVLRR